MRLTRVVIALFLGLCLALAFGQPALAGLRVSGAKIEAEVSPGSQTDYQMNVSNTSDTPMDITVEARGYGTSTTNSFIELKPEEDTSRYTARNFLTAFPSSFHLEPGKSQDVTVTAKIPEDVGAGGRYAIIVIQTGPIGKGVATIAAVDTRVLLTIEGSKLTTVSEIAQPILGDIRSDGSLGALLTITDNGNYHYKPRIQGTLKSDGKVVATALTEDDWPIIPSYSRQFQLNFIGRAPLPAGKYEVDIEVKDESGNLVTKGTFPLEVSEKQVAPPEKGTVPQGPVVSGTQSPAPAVTPAPTPPAPAPARAVSWKFLGGILSATVIIIVVVVSRILARRRRAVRSLDHR
jgi:hypothetical protein